MIFLRILGGWAVLAAVIAVVNDATRSYETGAKFSFASFGKDWYLINPGSLNALQAGIEKHVTPVLWDPVLLTLLKAPAFAVFGVLGILLYFAGLRRRRLNIYAN